MRADLSAMRHVAFAAAATVLGWLPAHAQDAIVQPGFAVVTGYSGYVAPDTPPPDGADPTDYLMIDPAGVSATVMDLTKLGPQGSLSAVPKTFTLHASDVGQVFGVALDDADAPNIYLAATSAYGLSIVTADSSGRPVRTQTGVGGAEFAPDQFGPGGGPGSIWKVDGTSGAVSLFATIDSGTGSVAALGGLAFDPATQQLFVADRGSGIVYRLGIDGSVRGTYDHGVEGRPDGGLTPIPAAPVAPVNIEDASFDTGNPATWSFAPAARRVFALAVYRQRLYYSVAQGPQVWSAAISPTGAVSGARLEVEAPSLADGEEIASIAFDGQGNMYLAERGQTTGDYTLTALAKEGQSRVLRFVPKPAGDTSPGLWRLTPDVYSVGMPPAFANADGGVALNYGYKPDDTMDFSACKATLWSSGERLLDPGDGSVGFPTVDGIQGNATALFQPQNMPPAAAWYVDFDDQAGDTSFRGYMGAIATLPCPGAPPLVCPTGLINLNGACVYPPCPTGQIRRGTQCVPPPPKCLRPLTLYPNGACGCPNPNDILSFDGKRCMPPPCPQGTLRQGGACVPICNPRTQDLYNNQCVPKCPDNWTHVGQSGRCVPPPCDQRTNDIYKGQCVPKCPPGWDHTGDDGRCKPRCPVGITAIPGCNPPPCDLSKNDMYKGQCVPKCPRGQVHTGDNGACQTPCDLTRNDMYKGQCVPKCPTGKVHTGDNGACQTPCDLTTHDMYKGQCLAKCPDGQVHTGNNGVCKTPCDLRTNEMFKGQCVPKCTPPQIRLKNGQCSLITRPLVPLTPTCDPSKNDVINGQCVPKCVPPKVRQKNGSCAIPRPSGLDLIPVPKIDKGGPVEDGQFQQQQQSQ
ncbi:MAG TPA: hypothetical protein VG894_08395 [Bauldia sp.]|nr:hypothetical protein [Bauldia sp.]